MVSVLTLLPAQRNIQINIQLVSTLFVMSYTTYVMPFSIRRSNYQETFNEIIVLLCSYHLFVFTEWVYDVDQRYRMGWSLLCLVVFLLVTNIGILAFVSLKRAYWNSRRKYFTRRNTKIIKRLKTRRAIFEKDPEVGDAQLEGDFYDDLQMVGKYPNYTMQWMDKFKLARDDANSALNE